MTRFATQRTRAFSFDNFATENKANSAKNFRDIVKSDSTRLFPGLHSYRP